MIPVSDYLINPDAIFAVRWLSQYSPRILNQRVLQVFLRYPVDTGSNLLMCERGQEDAVINAVTARKEVAA